MNEKKRILAVVGPTASGKTALSVELALKYNGEVISADSMQIYKGMSIATAKPDSEEMKGVPHHLMDFLDPKESFSVSDIQFLQIRRLRILSQEADCLFFAEVQVFMCARSLKIYSLQRKKVILSFAGI